MKLGMNKKKLIGLVLLSIFSLMLIMLPKAYCFNGPNQRRPPFKWDITPEEMERLRALLPVYFNIKAILAILNSFFILLLVLTHLGIYRKTGTKFSLGLVLFSTALLMYTLLSNPWLYGLIGFRTTGFGPLLMIPDVFTLIASVVLLYISRQ